jgi:hypothetical protein
MVRMLPIIANERNGFKESEESRRLFVVKSLLENILQDRLHSCMDVPNFNIRVY